MAVKKIVYDAEDIKALLKRKAAGDLHLDSQQFDVSVTFHITKADHSDPRGSTGDSVTFECTVTAKSGS